MALVENMYILFPFINLYIFVSSKQCDHPNWHAKWQLLWKHIFCVIKLILNIFPDIVLYSTAVQWVCHQEIGLCWQVQWHARLLIFQQTSLPVTNHLGGWVTCLLTKYLVINQVTWPISEWKHECRCSNPGIRDEYELSRYFNQQVPGIPDSVVARGSGQLCLVPANLSALELVGALP